MEESEMKRQLKNGGCKMFHVSNKQSDTLKTVLIRK